MKFIASFLGGLILAALAAILVTTTFAASPEKGGSWGWDCVLYILGLRHGSCAWSQNACQGMAETTSFLRCFLISGTYISNNLYG